MGILPATDIYTASIHYQHHHSLQAMHCVSAYAEKLSNSIDKHRGKKIDSLEGHNSIDTGPIR